MLSVRVCTFAHTLDELREIPNLHKSKLCTLYKCGKCPYGIAELRILTNKQEAQICLSNKEIGDLVMPANFFTFHLNAVMKTRALLFQSNRICRIRAKRSNKFVGDDYLVGGIIMNKWLACVDNRYGE
jgi:hypothetical protein